MSSPSWRRQSQLRSAVPRVTKAVGRLTSNPAAYLPSSVPRLTTASPSMDSKPSAWAIESASDGAIVMGDGVRSGRAGVELSGRASEQTMTRGPKAMAGETVDR